MKIWKVMAVTAVAVSAMAIIPQLTQAVAPKAVGLSAMSNIEQLPYLKLHEQAGQSSSYQRDGGNADFIGGDFRNYLYDDANGDKVLLDLKGPGSVYRMWFTGYDSNAALKVYFDGETTPRINTTFGHFFDGGNAPFLKPLVGNADVSSGGSYSYLPLDFNSGVKIATNNASNSFYFNFNYHTFDTGTPVATWTGTEDSTVVRNQWNNVGADPKSDEGNTVVSGSTHTAAGVSSTLLDQAGPRSVSALKLTIPGLVGNQVIPEKATDDGRAHKGSSQFTMAIDPANDGAVLKRRLDFGIADQKANVYVDGVLAGEWYTPGSDHTHRWRDSSFSIPGTMTSGKSAITIQIVFVSAAVDWNEFTYWIESVVSGTPVQTDSVDVGNATSESTHAYTITTPTWSGKHTLKYPPNTNPVDEGRAHKGSSQFTMAIDPANQGVILQRRLDFIAADQEAAVYVDGIHAGDWTTAGSDPNARWRTYGFEIPANLTAGKSTITVQIVFVSAAVDWNEFTYWIYSKKDATRVWSDTLDVGDAESESAHNYTVSGQTWYGTQQHSYPSLESQRAILNNTRLQISWDNETAPSVDAPIGAFFGIGQLGPQYETRSLLYGMLEDGTLYSYFPMPFASRAVVTLVNNGSTDLGGVQYELRHKAFSDSFQNVGYFKTAYNVQDPTQLDKDIVLLDAEGSGHVVGIVESQTGETNRIFLEGDERALIDDSRSPQLHGTGTEDFFNGGWYYDRGPFALPTHGHNANFSDSTSASVSAYRTFISDSIPFRKHIRFTIQHGPDDNTSSSAWTLAHYYAKTAKLQLSDTLQIGNGRSERKHSYSISGQTWKGQLTDTFEGEFDTTSVTADGRAHKGSSQFTMAIDPANQGVVLRRMFDQAIGNQRADVYVDGQKAGTWYRAGKNVTHQWREEEFKIPASLTSGKSSIKVKVQFVSSDADWNEFRYQTYSLLP